MSIPTIVVAEPVPVPARPQWSVLWPVRYRHGVWMCGCSRRAPTTLIPRFIRRPLAVLLEISMAGDGGTGALATFAWDFGYQETGP